MTATVTIQSKDVGVTIRALRELATSIERDARGRGNAGPRLKDHRADLRAQARNARRIALELERQR